MWADVVLSSEWAAPCLDSRQTRRAPTRPRRPGASSGQHVAAHHTNQQIPRASTCAIVADHQLCCRDGRRGVARVGGDQLGAGAGGALALLPAQKAAGERARLHSPADGGRRSGDGLLPLGHGRLTPSFRWIAAAFRLSEDDVLRRHGLDALVVIRLFKFGCVIVESFQLINLFFPGKVQLVRIDIHLPGLNSVVTGYLPSMILNAFIYLVPFAMLGMASFEGCISNSQKEIKACNMVFYFLLGNVFFLSVLSGSLLDQIGESFTHPKNIPSHLASAVSAQSDFFITYILTNGMSGFSLEVLQFGLLTWQFLKAHSVGHSEEPYLYGFPYYRVVPIVSLAILIGMVYAVVAPLLLPILLIYFLLGYAVYINQVAKENDELDETEQMTEGGLDNAVSAYKPPWMHPTNLEFDSVQPLNL
ncbi:hypothetical protein PR202_ga08301 [Eleusine coracana subsp. coracana]|uniref:CSC1/OSCA1-like 7TM region domain-containing protein n=1 Tax=Eleusine coracana subsp. coracana TaxID=191504 RepID=A0AAV5C104_ELECO|nr:hypothetical protein PR202_ga08301 [Eleusine coracana subsp. coracana]